MPEENGSRIYEIKLELISESVMKQELREIKLLGIDFVRLN